MSDIKDRLIRRFCDREYRHSYVESFLNSLVSAQIRAMREREEISQEELARLIGTTQPGISRFESPDYSSWRIDTLRKIARAFDVCLSVKFVSFGDAVDDITRFGDDKLMRPSFAHDSVFHPGVGERNEGPLDNVIDSRSRFKLQMRTPLRVEDEVAHG